MDVFIIQSPLQLLSAFEAKEYFQSKKSLLIVGYQDQGASENDSYLKKVLEITTWDSIFFFNLGGGRIQKHLANLKVLTYTRKVILSEKKIENLFLGEYRAIWMHQIRSTLMPQKTYLLDDGTAIIDIQNTYLSQGIYWPPKETYETSFLLKFLYSTLYRPFENKKHKNIPIHLFTIFNSKLLESNKEQINVTNSFHNLRSLSCCKKRESHTVFYFGQCLSEYNIVSLDYEISFIQKAFLYYKEMGLRFLYIPHRNDKEEKLEILRSINDVEVIHLNEPAEMYFILADVLPLHIGSAFSTVLTTLPIFISFNTVTAFLIPFECMNSERRSRYKQAYDYYRANHVSIVNFGLSHHG